MISKSTDLLAKLLAQENISVAYARAATASFNIKTRVLTIPNWKNMTQDVLDLMVFHEVGHALWTTSEYTDFLGVEVDKKYPNMKYQSYLNVIEDVRIERLIKRQFPGVRKMFVSGYNQLIDGDFFGVPRGAFNSLNFIDRINIYCKAGFSTDIKFNAEEKEFVTRIENTSSIKDVIKLAEEVYAFAEAQEKEKSATALDHEYNTEESDAEDQFEDDSEEDEAGNGYYEEDEDGYETQENLAEGNYRSNHSEYQEDPVETTQEKLESKTLNTLAKKLEESANTDIEYKYWTLDTFKYDPIITYKEILEVPLNSYQPVDPDAVKTFKQQSSNVVSYLVKEFEMKKSAQLYKRAQTAKIGAIDTRKLYAYTIKDDLFKRITTLPLGKNHGMVMLVDWSSSMNKCIHETLEQVVNLVMFCRNAQIPFEVYAFTDYTRSKDLIRFIETKEYLTMYETTPENVISVYGRMSLLQLFSDKMTNSQFNAMIAKVLDKNFTSTYHLGTTPLNEALAYMIDYLPVFRKKNNTEKMTFITLTDGDGSALRGIATRSYDHVKGKTVRIDNFIADPVTKKNYPITSETQTHTKQLLQILKDRTDATVLGFYVSGIHASDIYRFVNSHYGENNFTTATIVEECRKQIRENNYASFKGTGRDDLFFVPIKSTKINTTELVVDSSKNVSTIARGFAKHLNTKKTSRVLLSKFIDYIA